jgi:hypothetical protein
VKRPANLARGGVGTWVILGAFLIAIMASAILLLAVNKPASLKGVRPNVTGEFNTCRAQFLADVRPPTITTTLEAEIANTCIGIIHNSYAIADFDVRREAFVEQYQEQHFILWLVLSITLSGIALTALQLVSSYNLSLLAGYKFEAGGSLQIEERRLAIQSAVSGLIILCLSFGFFLAYLIWVYPISETDNVQMDPQQAIHTPTAQQQSPSPGAAPVGAMAGPSFMNRGTLPAFVPTPGYASAPGYLAPAPLRPPMQPNLTPSASPTARSAPGP